VLAWLTLLVLVLGISAAYAQQTATPQELPPGAKAGLAAFGIVGTIMAIVGLVLWIWIMVFLYKDAKARAASPGLWVALGFLFSWIALIIWLIVRPKK